MADNGIKFFGADGFKLSDAQEEEIETLLDQDNPDLPRPVGTDIVHFSDYFEGAQKYLSYLKSTIDVNLEGLKITLDGANGSTSALAPFLFGDLELILKQLAAAQMVIILMIIVGQLILNY